MRNTLFIIILILFNSCGNNNELETRVTELETRVTELETDVSELKQQIKNNSDFENELACQELLDRLKDRWNNVVGCYYSEYQNTCMVKYKVDGIIKESRVEDMQDTD